MTEHDIARYQDILVTTATDVGLKILAAIAFWVIGRWLIGVVIGMIRSSLERQKVDPTVLRYIGSVVTVTLNVLLVVGILGYFGIQTTTFAACTKPPTRISPATPIDIAANVAAVLARWRRIFLRARENSPLVIY